MAEEEPAIAGRSAALAKSEAKSKEQVKEELRGPVRGLGARVGENIFEDPAFQKVMNRWMIGTHISWGISLAFTFIGLNYTLIWLNPPPWTVVATFGPCGFGYLLYQWNKFRRKRAAP